MTDSIFKKLAAVTMGTALIFAGGEIMPVQAAQLTYHFSNTNKTLTGAFSFDQAAAADQQITTSEGLKIFATYNGQSYTEANDPLALVLTDSSGKIPKGQGLGLQFTPGTFEVYSGNFIDLNDVQIISYTSVPEPNFTLGLSVLALGVLFAKKQLSSRSSSTKA